jgi:hypothetical protein
VFFTLLLVTFVIATVVSIGVIKFFDKSIARILARIVTDELVSAWHRYIQFAAYVVGISGGVRVYNLEQYINARHMDQHVLELNAETWVLEIYRTVIGTLQSLAWVLLVVFVVALIAFVIVRVFEIRRSKPGADMKAGSHLESDA